MSSSHAPSLTVVVLSLIAVAMVSGQRRTWYTPAGYYGNSQCCTAVQNKVVALEKSVRTLSSQLRRVNLQYRWNEMRPCGQKTFERACYKVIFVDGARWQMFWWYKPGQKWPKETSDVLEDEYGACKPHASHCFGRLPHKLRENRAEILAVDSFGTRYRWRFDSRNTVAHATWEALHNHREIEVRRGDPWRPKVISGQRPRDQQVSFLYRMEHGVKSVLLGSGYCDCMSTISLGHAMCRNSYDHRYGKENTFGVDKLYDRACSTPHETHGLFLYFRDDDNCAGVRCPRGKSCQDGIDSYRCI